LILLASPVMSADGLPQQFVGDWCADSNAPEARLTPYEPNSKVNIYRRARKCREAEDSMIVRPDHLFIAGEVTCKFLETVSVTRHGTHRLKFWCKHANNESWTFDAWVSAPARNRLAVQDSPMRSTLRSPLIFPTLVGC
jgi:hypothetical protein